jgi:tetrahydromethanopterin S-methyltransferase subunit F
MTNDERKAVEQARETLSALTPTTARTDAIVQDLRYASGLMARAASKGFSSEMTLNNLRGDASTALNAVTGAFDRRTITKEVIDRARQAIALVLDQLPA